MDPAIRLLIESLHQAPCKCVLAFTGGGTGAAGWLLSVPGGSRTILEVVVPYGEKALVEYLGGRPEHFCSAPTCRAMARRACDRARWLAPGEAVAGLACTASLASDHPKRGEHRFHVAWCRDGRYEILSLTLTKGARDRLGEEELLDRVVLNCLSRAFRIDGELELALLPGEKIQIESQSETPLADFFENRGAVLWLGPDGHFREPQTKPAGLLPGSFNPVHEGHRSLAAIAARILGGPVGFELSVDNVDKPPLEPGEVRRRLAALAWRTPVVLTRAPTFWQKALLFPGMVFVVGTDTAERIAAPRYYGGEEGMVKALKTIRENGCRFLVAGRLDHAGKFIEVGKLELPTEFRDLFTPIPAGEFRVDISSTELRQGRGKTTD